MERKITKQENNTIKEIRNLFRLKKIKVINDGIIRDIWNLLEQEEDYYKPVRIIYFWSNNYIEYKSNDDNNKALSVEEHLNKIRPHLENIMNDLKKLDT